MKKRKWLLAAAGLLSGLLVLSGCAPASDSAKEERGLTPYSLFGEKDGWEISCVVRPMTQAEKEEELASLRELQSVAESQLANGEIDEETCENLKQQYERTAQNLEEKTAYVSSVYGVCREEGAAGQSAAWQLESGGVKVVAGVQIVSADPGEWYSSYQMDGPLFIPPLEEGTMRITVGEETVSIPLTLATHTEKTLE